MKIKTILNNESSLNLQEFGTNFVKDLLFVVDNYIKEIKKVQQKQNKNSNSNDKIQKFLKNNTPLFKN